VTPEESLDSATLLPRSKASNGLPLPDLVSLQLLMFDVINIDRGDHDLAPVEWDETAAVVGQAHAEQMASLGYFSHWNPSGHGPDIRYALAGGRDVVTENIASYWCRWDDGRPAPIEDWDQLIRDQQAGLMRSPSHRSNILDPAHTHVGIGIAYNPTAGDVRIAQEFINRYVVLDPLPASLPIGAEVVLQGEILPAASDPLVNLAFEPFPQPLSMEHLAATSTYVSPTEIYEAIGPETITGSRFAASFPMDYQGSEGFYHIRVWVQVGEERFPAADAIVAVRDR
jgi:uncharacterized protein YkwD